MNAGYVKIYDTNPETLKQLSNTNLKVSIMIPNEQIPQIGTNEDIARRWIQENVLPYIPQTKIRYIMVGNEILSNRNQDQWDNLVPAMRLVKKILRNYDIHNIKVSTPLGMDFLDQSFPPSNASFKVDYLNPLVPLLEFLDSSRTNLFLDVYPYFPWSADPNNIDLDYALLNDDPREQNVGYQDPGSGLVYTNLLDQMIDSVYFAMSKLGFTNIGITISETGWPNAGDDDEVGANVENAEVYTRNLIRKIMADPPIGTPARPGSMFVTFLFALFDEDLKSGRGTERHWGLLRPDGTPVFQIDLSGTGATSAPGYYYGSKSLPIHPWNKKKNKGAN